MIVPTEAVSPDPLAPFHSYDTGHLIGPAWPGRRNGAFYPAGKCQRGRRPFFRRARRVLAAAVSLPATPQAWRGPPL